MKKSKLLIVLIFCWISSFGQVPDTGTFTLSDAIAGVCTMGEPLDACGSYLNPTTLDECIAVAEYITNNLADYWDASYEGSHNSLYCLRNYGGGGCQRPGGLTTVTFYNMVDGVSIDTDYDACYYAANFSCMSQCGSTACEMASFSDGYNVYVDPYATDCTVLTDGYYVVDYYGTKYAAQVYAGMMYFVYC